MYWGIFESPKTIEGETVIMVEDFKEAPSKFELIYIDKAIEQGLVWLDEFEKPCCKEHGAMNAVKKDCTVYRCLAFSCPIGIKTTEMQGNVKHG